MSRENRNRSAHTVAIPAVFLLAVSGTVNASDVRIEQAKVEVVDGVDLSTTLYLPEADGSFPTVLLRTPYGSTNMGWIAEYLATHDYVVAVQDVRGLNGSGGEFIPFAHEKNDGLATLEWLLEQPFCNGEVGLWGSSYLGFAANEIASTGHPAVKAMVVLSGWSDVAAFIAPGGCFHLMAHLPWFITVAGQQRLPEQAWPQVFRATPIAQFFPVEEEGVEELLEEPYGYAGFTMPILHVTGWYDYIYPDMLRAYESILRQAADTAEQKLIVGVWPHNNVMNGQSNAGDEDFGPAAAWGVEKVNETGRRWFDLHLKGEDDGMGGEAPVRLFMMGSNEWCDFEAWPPEAVQMQPWFVDCTDVANGAAGSGTLAAKISEGQASDQFVFDPHDPVPTTGGANWHVVAGNQGVLDQREVARRLDVLVYTSRPLASPLTLVGPVRATVYASTEGKDTDFTAKLVEVRADGYARNIVDGVVRASHQFDLGSDSWLEADRVYGFEIDMGATAIRLQPGSRLRLEISSSNFPKYDRNPNTGEDAMTATELLPVTQTVYHSTEYPTHVLLPVQEDIH
jgi:hypothetical protein